LTSVVGTALLQLYVDPFCTTVTFLSDEPAAATATMYLKDYLSLFVTVPDLMQVFVTFLLGVGKNETEFNNAGLCCPGNYGRRVRPFDAIQYFAAYSV
jgi:hypothetical protein